MSEQLFTLVRFPDSNIPEIEIYGKVARQSNILTIHYHVTGQTEDILFPESSAQPARKDELWLSTCFEFFLAIPDRAPYWEFNLSPSGDWNVYYMDAYRRIGFREETSVERLPFSVRREASCVSVEASADLSPIIAEVVPVQAGITSVIQTLERHETYWALTHPNPQADFHLRDSFILALGG